MNYCSNCGSDKIQFEVPTGDNRFRFVCSTCTLIHYSNPRLIVGILAIHESQILLCKRAIEPQLGLWNLPAGFLENGETAEAGAVRETVEEANAKVELLKLHCVFSIPDANQIYLHFLANLPRAEFNETAESLEVRLFKAAEIPWNELAFSSTEFALRKYIDSPDFQGVHIGSSDKAW